MMKNIIAYLSIFIFISSVSCSDMVKMVMDPDESPAGGIEDSAAYSIGGTIKLPGAIEGEFVDAKVVDSDGDNTADGLDLNDDNAADIIYLPAALAKSGNNALALDVTGNGEADFYLILGGSGDFSINLSSDGSGNAVTVVVDESTGLPAGFDSDGDGSFDINVEYELLDTVAPTIDDSTISTGAVSQTSIELTWELATDDKTLQTNLEYSVYFSSSDNIETVADAETNGALDDSTPLSSLTSSPAAFTVSDLSQSTTYYFNIVVSDIQNNKAAYTSISATTSDTASPIGSWDDTDWNNCLWAD